MSQPSEADSTAKPVAAGGPEHMRWDTSTMRTHCCTVASASTTAAAVVLNFGAKRSTGDPAGEISVELLQRVALSPLTAKHFTATLERLLAEYDRLSAPTR
jgi:hypothetical protein